MSKRTLCDLSPMGEAPDAENGAAGELPTFDPFCDVAGKRRTEGGNEAGGRGGGIPPHGYAVFFNAARKFYAQRNVRQIVEGCVSDTLVWLDRNNESYSSAGLKTAKAWALFGSMPYTQDPLILEERRQDLRARLYEHGMQYFLHLLAQGLAQAGLTRAPVENGCVMPLIVDVGTSSTAWALVRDLVKIEHGIEIGIYEKVEPYGLENAHRLYHYAPGCDPSHTRRNLVPLARFGLISAAVNRGYDITPGPAGHVFYHKIFRPMLERFEPTIFGVQK